MISCETFETDENIFISYTDLLSQLVSNTHFFFFCQPVTKTLFDKDRCETSKCPATVS